MLKTVKIHGKDVQFKYSAIFPLHFKNHFQQDVFKVIFPILEMVTSIPRPKTNKKGKQKSVELEDIMTAFQSSDKFELLDIYKILYVLNYTADKSIGSFEDWLEFIDDFSIITLVVEIFPDLITSFATTVQSKKKVSPQARK